MFGIGFLTLRQMVEAKDGLAWNRAKLNPEVFRGAEKDCYTWVRDHVMKHHVLPSMETLVKYFPEVKEYSTPEPTSFYLEHLLKRFEFDTLKEAAAKSIEILKDNKEDTVAATKVAQDALHSIAKQRNRTNLSTLTSEAFPLVLGEYHSVHDEFAVKAEFGWPYLDLMSGGVIGGDIVSFIGRPGEGKTFQMLYNALYNWKQGRPVLFASMEMATLPITQRIAAMHTHLPLTQLKMKGFSSGTYKKFTERMMAFSQHGTPFYVVDGNLALYVDELYNLAAILGCQIVYADGAYLMKHPNPRLDRFTRVAENVEAMKKASTDLLLPTFASWQFGRSASKAKKSGEKAGLEDIGYSDAIGQISTLVLGVLQEQTIATISKKTIDVLKGRNGEVGQFDINWDFILMNFDQINEGSADDENEEAKKELALQKDEAVGFI